ncbi:glucosyltransferase, partial [Entomortierella lignicola]
GSAVAVTFRQTNIIWALFILGTALLNLFSVTERRRYDPKAAFMSSPIQLIYALTGFVHALLTKLPAASAIAIPYLGLLAGFAAFIKWNGGIVLGDRSNHVATLHIVQLFYFAAFSAGMSVFAILGVVPLARLLRKPKFRLLVILIPIASIMAFCVHKFTDLVLLASASNGADYIVDTDLCNCHSTDLNSLASIGISILYHSLHNLSDCHAPSTWSLARIGTVYVHSSERIRDLDVHESTFPMAA